MLFGLSTQMYRNVGVFGSLSIALFLYSWHVWNDKYCFFSMLRYIHHSILICSYENLIYIYIYEPNHEGRFVFIFESRGKMSSLVSPYVFVCMSRKAPNFEEGLCSNMWTMEEECNKCLGFGPPVDQPNCLWNSQAVSRSPFCTIWHARTKSHKYCCDMRTIMYNVSFILYSIICRCCLNICLEAHVVIHICIYT